MNLHRKHNGFPKKVAEAHEFIETIKKQKCPSCNNTKLYPLTTEIGTKDATWEAKVRCDSCGSIGVYNSTGFHIEHEFHKAETTVSEVKQ